MNEPREPMTIGDRLAWAGLLLVALLCLARAMAEHDPFPWWQSDPFRFAPPITGLTPRWALLLNAGIVLGGAVTLLGQMLRKRAVSGPAGMLLLLGMGVIGYHQLIDIERVLDASTVAASVAALIAAAQAGTLPGARRVLGGVAIGFVIMLTIVGLHEVFVTHAQTLRLYEQNRESFLAARGWSAGSFEALAYERRLRNPEPLAWFGLTNVFASFTAASGAGLLTLAFGCWRRHRRLSTLAMISGLASLFALMLTGSKGGFGVLIIGLALGAACVRWPKRRIDGRVVLALCAMVLLGLIARGMLGESSGERSLLFRWQYLVGAVRIWLADPIVGCGPGLFQDRYALLKPALSPEDVSSPHDVYFAWIATLGVGGLALAALLARSVWGLAPGTNADEADTERQQAGASSDDPVPGRDRLTRFTLLLIALPMLLTLKLRAGVLTTDELLLTFFGAGMWCWLGLAFVRSRLPERALHTPLFVTGAVLAVHAMLELTGTLIVSAPLWALMIGLAFRHRSHRPASLAGAAAVTALVGNAGIMLARWGTINAWERELHAGARAAALIADTHDQLDAIETSPDPERQLARAAELLGQAGGVRVAPTLDAIIPALHRAEFEARAAAVDRLREALEARASHIPTRIACSQQMLWLASVRQAVGDAPASQARWDEASALFEGVPLNAGGHRWAGQIWRGRASAFPEDPRVRSWLERARDHLESAMRLAPHDPHTAVRLMDLATDLNDADSVRAWARLTLKLHERMRLDPLRGLGERDLERARALAGL